MNYLVVKDKVHSGQTLMGGALGTGVMYRWGGKSLRGWRSLEAPTVAVVTAAASCGTIRSKSSSRYREG